MAATSSDAPNCDLAIDSLSRMYLFCLYRYFLWHWQNSWADTFQGQKSNSSKFRVDNLLRIVRERMYCLAQPIFKDRSSRPTIFGLACFGVCFKLDRSFPPKQSCGFLCTYFVSRTLSPILADLQ